MSDLSGTPRQRIEALISERARDAGSLSRELSLKQREVENHLKHIESSSKARGKKFLVHPSRCLSCEFIFKGRERSTKPSRCPKCKNEQTSLPAFEIRTRA